MSKEASGPHIQLAVFCEHVLTEQDGVLSLIRIIDRSIITINDPAAPKEMPPTQFNLKLVLALKAGGAKGRRTIRIIPEDPAGQPMSPVDLPILFESEDRGTNLVILTGFMAKLEGLYWFDVLLDDILLTRMPLRIVYNRLQSGVGPGGSQ